jgi:uncharacterized Ntn-hydrolase superfamily protein
MKEQDKLDKIVAINKTNRDYLSDYFASKDLAENIESYWHSRGYPKVKVWVEIVNLQNGSKRFEIRGNITFDCSKISFK